MKRLQWFLWSLGGVVPPSVAIGITSTSSLPTLTKAIIFALAVAWANLVGYHEGLRKGSQ